MNEILGVMGLEVLTGLLLALGLFLGFAALASGRRITWARKAQLLAVSLLCLSWANLILGYSLAPRYVHGSALAPGAGPAEDGDFYVVDQYGWRAAVPEAEFQARHGYEEGSLWLPLYVTPPAVLVLLVAGWLRRLRGADHPNRQQDDR